MAAGGHRGYGQFVSEFINCGYKLKSKKVNLATHMLVFLFQGFTGFRWPVAFLASCTAKAYELYINFWHVVDAVEEKGFTVMYCMMDGASTNRSFWKMHFAGPPLDARFITHNIYNPKCKVVFIQDIMHKLKKIRNSLVASRQEHYSTDGKYLLLKGKPIVWDFWLKAYEFNKTHGVRIHHKLTAEHMLLDANTKMRNGLAKEVLNTEMLRLFSVMKDSKSNPLLPGALDGVLDLLHITSNLVDIFDNKQQPITTLTDTRLVQLHKTVQFFQEWDSEAKKNQRNEKKCLMTAETREDVLASVCGFISLCELVIPAGVSITPGYINSDCIENFFCQQRGICGGNNTNPTIAMAGPNTNTIIMGQISVSRKGNTGMKAEPFMGTLTPKSDKKHVNISLKL